MFIEYRNLTSSDVDLLTRSVLDALSLDHEEDILKDAETMDVKLLIIHDRETKPNQIIILHGFPGDTAVWVQINEQMNHIEDESSPLCHKFKKWYDRTTKRGTCFELELFYSYSMSGLYDTEKPL